MAGTVFQPTSPSPDGQSSGGGNIFDRAYQRRHGAPPPEANTPSENEAAASEHVTEPTVMMPDGSHVSPDVYFQSQTQARESELAAQQARLDERERWLHPPEATAQQPADAPQGPEPIQWQPYQVDREALEDNEAVLYDHLNSMGEQFTGVINHIQQENHALRQQLGDTSRVTQDMQLNTEFARAEAQHGVTRQEILDVYRDNPNSHDMGLLAEVAALRKQAASQTEASQAAQQQETQSALSRIGSATHEQGAARVDESDRASKVTDYRDGAQIAQHFRAFTQ